MYKYVNGPPHILCFVFIWDKRQENENVRFTNDKPKKKKGTKKNKTQKKNAKTNDFKFNSMIYLI